MPDFQKESEQLAHPLRTVQDMEEMLAFLQDTVNRTGYSTEWNPVDVPEPIDEDWIEHGWKICREDVVKYLTGLCYR